MLVAARTRPELTPEAISLFIVELPNAGVAISKLKKEGIRGSETGLIHIDDVFVPDDALLGGARRHLPGDPRLAQREPRRRGRQRAGHGARAPSRRRCAYAARPHRRGQAHRRLPGRAPPPRRHGGARSRRRAGWCYYGAWRVDQGTLDAATAAKVKLVASETAVRVSENAIRILGGAGIMREYPVGRIHRDALVYVIGEGTSDIQRNIIARDLGFKT